MEELKKTHTITFIISDDLYQKLIEIGHSSDRPLGSVIRQIIKKSFSEDKKKAKK